MAVRLIAVVQASSSRAWPSIAARAAGEGAGEAPPARRRGRRRRPAEGRECPRRASGAARAVGPGHASCGSRADPPRGATPGVAIVSHRRRGSVFPVRPVRGRVSPSPSRTALPSRLPQCGCRTVEAGRARVNGVFHQLRGGRRESWITAGRRRHVRSSGRPARTGRPSVRRTTSITSSTYSSALPCSAAVRTQP